MQSQTGATLRTWEALKNLIVEDRNPLSVSAQAAHSD
jgi:hypothetical protein